MKYSADYVSGFVRGFLMTAEGFNAEYGSLGGFGWNCPNLEDIKMIELKLIEFLDNDLEGD